jgi:hypothetical protein
MPVRAAYDRDAKQKCQKQNPMKSSWMPEAKHLACHWSEVGRPLDYEPGWMLENSEGHGGWLPPVSDFPSHSPFGGASWFHPRPDVCLVAPERNAH